MQKALDIFRKSIGRVEHLAGLYRAMASLTTPAVDSSDLLRAQIVLAVSALDFYVHEVVVLGMIEVYKGIRPSTSAFDRYKISAGAMMIGHPAGGTTWLEAEIRERHSFLSFQQPDKIADAIRLFSNLDLWKSVGTELCQDDTAVKSMLKLIVDRRNKVAHEADLDPSYPGARWPIYEGDTDQSRKFISDLVEAIHRTIV